MFLRRRLATKRICWKETYRQAGWSSFRRQISIINQFRVIKKQFKKYILLFQVGDFYEVYEEDAVAVCAKTTLRLTSKNGYQLGGFPVKALTEWQRTLVQAGFQLAVCNQTSTNDSSSSSVKHPMLKNRRVVKLVTPGTLIEPLQDKSNYLLSIATSPSSVVGLAWADISTSEFMVSSLEVDDVDESLERIAPAEVLLSSGIVKSIEGCHDNHGHYDDHASVVGLTKSSLLKDLHLTGVPPSWYTREGEAWQEEVGLDEKGEWLDAGVENEGWPDAGLGGERDVPVGDAKKQWLDTGLDEKEWEWLDTFEGLSQLELTAARALIFYVKYTQRGPLPHLTTPTHFNQKQHMLIDASTRRSLELTVPHYMNSKKITLLATINRTTTAQGARLLASRLASPLTNMEETTRRLAKVNLFYEDILNTEAVVSMLKKCQDLERSVQKVVIGSGHVTDLHLIKSTLQRAGNIRDYILSNFDDLPLLQEEMDGIADLSGLVEELDAALSSGRLNGYIADGYSNDIDNLRTDMKGNEDKVSDLLKSLKKATFVSRMRVVPQRGMGRVLEVPGSQAHLANKCPELIRVEQSRTKTKYSHFELQKLNVELFLLESSYSGAQAALFKKLCDKIIFHVDDIMGTALALARLDVTSSLARLATEQAYCKPVMVEGCGFNVVGGVHPVVTRQQQTNFIPNNCNLNRNNLWIITGPNMGGKSTFLRQNALVSILAQVGCFVPADSATLGMVDRLFARVGSSDNISKNMSTFQLEMRETAHILTNATPQSLVILDEIGRGTAQEEGLALANAVLHYIHNKIGCRTLMATHYHKLAVYGESLSRAACYKLTAKKSPNHIAFSYQVKPGYVNYSYAIDVAGLSGIPKEVLNKAKEFLKEHKNVPPSQSIKMASEETLITNTVLNQQVLNQQELDVLQRIRDLSLDHVTPAAALNTLYELRKELG